MGSEFVEQLQMDPTALCSKLDIEPSCIGYDNIVVESNSSEIVK